MVSQSSLLEDMAMSSEKKDEWLEIYNLLEGELSLLRMLIWDLKTQMFPDERSLEDMSIESVDKVKYHFGEKSDQSIMIIFNDKSTLELNKSSISELYKHLDAVLEIHGKFIEFAQKRLTHHADFLKELKDKLTPLLFATKL